MTKRKQERGPEPVWLWVDAAFEVLIALSGHARELHPKCLGVGERCGICEAIARAKALTAKGSAFPSTT